MKVKEIMSPDVMTCRGDTDVRTVGQVLARIGAGVLPVVQNNKLIGIVTDRDLYLGLVVHDARPSEIKVHTIMTPEVTTCSPDDEILWALRSMAAAGVRRLPVVEDDGAICGILSLDDVVLSARAAGGESFEGPLYANVTTTLKKILERRIAVGHEAEEVLLRT